MTAQVSDPSEAPGRARTETRERVLDAALELVAERGLQSLTHRGIEARAQVSHGVTTYYFKTRDALIDALFEHICQRQITWITAMYADLVAEAGADPGGFDREAFTRRGIEIMISERTLTLARYELYLHAARDSRLQQITAELRQRHVAIQTQLFAALGAPEPQLSANRFLSAVEGMLLYQVSVPEPDFERWATAYLILISDALGSFDPGR